MLHRYMSEPRWTTAQESEAERHCAGVERELEGHLYGARITPLPVNEVVPVTREGMVATSLPIASIASINGLAVVTDQDGPTLPDGYSLRDHRLWLASTTADAWAFGVPWFDRQRGYSGAPFYTGYSVALQYMGGWGAEPALVEAILRKAARRMAGRHADTVVLTGLNAQPANAPPNEPPHFTEDDLKALGPYRNLGWAGT